jgi:mannosyltransferase OCH1-like enzyme
MIPRIIHQIWVGHYDVPAREKRIAEEIANKHPNYEYKLWTDNNLPVIPAHLQPVYDKMYSQRDYVYCADMLRWLVVYQYGGWYLDIDWEYISNLDGMNIDHRSGIVFGHWGVGWQHCDYTFTNNVFAFEKNHPMVQTVINNMAPDLSYCSTPYGPGWTGIAVKNHLGLENEFSNEIWEYHRIVREHLEQHNIEYGDYNTFQNTVLKHHALYSWSLENKVKFEQGLIK